MITPENSSTFSDTSITVTNHGFHWLKLVLQRWESTVLTVYLLVFLTSLFIMEAYEPNFRLNFTLSFVFGLLTGIAAAITQEKKDGNIKNRTQLSEILPVPVLGIAPHADKQTRQEYALLTAQQPNSAVASAFHALRNNLLIITQQNIPKLINITSTDASEGKSSTTINLATAFAQTGKKVLLIDADLRRPTLHKHFKLDNTRGFGNYLAGFGDLESLIHSVDIPGLQIIPAGPVTPHPVELLSSGRLSGLTTGNANCTNEFDIIMIDSPPVMGLADALLISRYAHATLLVVACHQTRSRQLQTVFSHLRQAHINVIGTVLTKAYA
jgi:capsular exopolysaccharide synthesis family protein